MDGRGHLENLICGQKKCQYFYSINNLYRFGLDSAGSEQGSKMEGITQAEDPRERSCEERIWIQAGGSGNETIFMLSRYCCLNLFYSGLVNTVMGNHTFTRCDTKV